MHAVSISAEESATLRAAYMRRLVNELLDGEVKIFPTAGLEEQEEARQIVARMGIKAEEQGEGQTAG